MRTTWRSGVMAWVLVPSLTALLGRKAFWPGRTSRTGTDPNTAAGGTDLRERGSTSRGRMLRPAEQASEEAGAAHLVFAPSERVKVRLGGRPFEVNDGGPR
jgi:hypothetical protein